MNPVRPYKIAPDPETVVFVNGFKARNIAGFVWLWANLFGIIRSVQRAEGCFESIPALVGPAQVVMVSYWQSSEGLHHYLKSERHQKYRGFVYKYPKALALFNETYQPHQRGLYHNEPMGLAKMKNNPQMQTEKAWSKE